MSHIRNALRLRPCAESSSTGAKRTAADLKDLATCAVGGQIDGARDCQEDAFRILPGAGEANGLLLLLADGMGGHASGARAGKLAIDAFAAHFAQAKGDPLAGLRASLEAANEAIAKEVENDPQCAGMGCTLLACLVSGNELHWVSVGDSPLWLSRKGRVRRLNADHSMRPVLEDLVELGRAEDLATDPRANQLRSAVAGDEMAMIDQQKMFLRAGDWIILASDGVETLTTDEISEVCATHESPRAMVGALLQAVEARQQPRQDNATALVYKHIGAAARKRYALLAEQLGRQVSPTARDENDWTDLHYAATLNLPEMAAALLDAGMPVDARLKADRFTDAWERKMQALGMWGYLYEAGGQPLHIAARENACKVAKLLITRGADVNARCSYGATPLHEAARWDARTTAELLINCGADVNAKDCLGRTPLHAAPSEFRATAKLLIERGADMNAKDNNGETPLHDTATRGRKTVPKLAKLLIASGADLNAKNKHGRTPLHLAARKNAPATVKLLLERGADVNAKDNNGRTPLHFAAGVKNKDARKVVKWLRVHGADVSAKDKSGATPLDRAAIGEHWGSC